VQRRRIQDSEPDPATQTKLLLTARTGWSSPESAT